MSEEETKQDRSRQSCAVYLCCASGDKLAEAIEHALTDREHVVMVRVNDEVLRQLDMLVESGICKSRSSAATFMIREGTKSNAPLFAQISKTTEEILALKEKLRGLVQGADEEDEID